MSESHPCILFTAFEPSGDEHAAPVIAALRAEMPDVPIYALGGERMKAAGATIIENTVGNAAMLSGAMGKVREQLAIRKRLAAWLGSHAVAVHVPTDSPAANWGICKMIKRGLGERAAGSDRMTGGSKVVHLVAPQVWAWASWRVRRLHKWSDHVMCILPFEPDWFAERGVDATFIGHPLFNEPLKLDALTEQAASLPERRPRVALLPGSRAGEVQANWPIMRHVANQLSSEHVGISITVAAANERALKLLERSDAGVPSHFNLALGMTEAVLNWADVVLAASGTVTLHIARHRKPMAILYKSSALQWHLIGRWLIHTRTFTLPNLIASGGPSRSDAGHIVKEFVPFFGDADQAGPIVEEIEFLLGDEEVREEQQANLAGICRIFMEHDAGAEAAAVVTRFYRETVEDYEPVRKLDEPREAWRRFGDDA